MTQKRILNCDELSVEKKKKKKVEIPEEVQKVTETSQVRIETISDTEKEKEKQDDNEEKDSINNAKVSENNLSDEGSDTNSLKMSKEETSKNDKKLVKDENETEMEIDKKKEEIKDEKENRRENNEQKEKEALNEETSNVDKNTETTTNMSNEKIEISEKEKDNTEAEEEKNTKDSKQTISTDTNNDKNKKDASKKVVEEATTNVYQNTCYNMYNNNNNNTIPGYSYMNFPYDMEQYYNMTTTTSLNDNHKETTQNMKKPVESGEPNNANEKKNNKSSSGTNGMEPSNQKSAEKINEKVETTKDKNEPTQTNNANLTVNSNVQNMMTSLTNNVTNYYVNGLTGTNPYATNMNMNNQYANQLCMNQMNYAMNNTMNGYYMYNYINNMNDINYNYYYAYDGKSYGTDYTKNTETNVQPYDYRNAIDKSLEAMKRNNRAKEILKHPARLQVNPEELNKGEYTEGNDQYNIWFGKYVNDRFDKSAKNIPRFVAKYKCNPLKDSGYTRADKVYNSTKPFFCIYFARGCCAYGSNCIYRHRVPNENDELEYENSVDIFGREKFSTHREDMSGVGCFNNESRTLFIGSIYINDAADANAMEKILYEEFSPFGNIDYIRFIPHKNIAFIQFTNRVNAEFAKVAMSDQPIENHSTALTIKWAYEMKSIPTPNVPMQYYNHPYVYNNQMISSTWANYMMQQQPPQPPQPPQLPQPPQSTQATPQPPPQPSQLQTQYNAAYYGDYNQMYINQNKKTQEKYTNINNGNSNFIQVDQAYDTQVLVM